MRVIVAGGDGFCGWPTALHLSRRGYHVVLVDNLYRRKIDQELGVPSLTPILSIEERLKAWEELTGKVIPFYNMDLSTDYDEFVELIKREKPDAIVDFAKIRSAPYSMKTSKHKIETVRNNLGSAQVILAAIVDSGMDIHLVHLGTMGVYGYACPAGVIPEGYLDIFVKSPTDELLPWKILYPASPGSVYHLTKCQEALMFQFYNKCHKIRITDLHQGIVWGTNTAETTMDERLINRFDYDGDYGTFLNRFLVQAALDIDLTVYGTGGQKRAFIHVQGTARCIEIALQDPPKSPEEGVKIFNQVTEAYEVAELAELISRFTGASIAYLSNPRVEAAQNDLVVINQQFLDRGLKPITLEEGLMEEVLSVVKKYKERVVTSAIPPSTKWRKELPEPVKLTEKKAEIVDKDLHLTELKHNHETLISNKHAVC